MGLPMTHIQSLRKNLKGKAITFNGFSDKKKEERIDYIFVRSGMEVNWHRTVKIKQGDIFISDHWPVIAGVK